MRSLGHLRRRKLRPGAYWAGAAAATHSKADDEEADEKRERRRTRTDGEKAAHSREPKGGESERNDFLGTVDPRRTNRACSGRSEQ